MAAAHSTRDRVRIVHSVLITDFYWWLSFIDRLPAILERYLEERKEVIKKRVWIRLVIQVHRDG